MKLSVHGTNLADVLGKVSGTVQPRASRPVLQNVCIVAKGKRLDILATNMEVGIRHQVEDAEIHEEGSILLNGARLHSIARELVGGTVEIEATTSKAEIRSQGCYFNLVGDKAEDFPAIPTPPKEGIGITIKAEVLQGLVRHSVFAASAEESRYAIHGVLLCTDAKGKAQIVATDGKRLAWAMEDKPLKVKTDALLSPAGLRQIIAVIEPGVEDIIFAFDERRVVVQAGVATIAIQKVQGTFPAYEAVVPKETKINVDVDRENFTSSIRRAALLATEGSHAVAVGLRGGKLLVAAKASNIGEGRIETDLLYDGDDLDVHFNPKYVLDFCKVAVGEKIQIGINDSRSAVIFRDGETLTYVVMPITLDADTKK